ncbi:MAG: tRNA (5-methylaminomethyl-2-thiouridine)(34)-methyltransferase MnmD [Chitinophagaceae bacterium]
MVDRKIIVTADGSHSIQVEGTALTYHSLHGAIQESRHVFIEAGLAPWLQQQQKQLRIFEMGFGTGLNAWLTWLQARQAQQSIYYTSIEQFPLTEQQANSLNYCAQLGLPQWQPDFLSMHSCAWNSEHMLDSRFTLYKIQSSLTTLSLSTEPFHLFYFDAFAPTAQPELWTEEIFSKLFALAAPGATLLTYCSKSVVRRAMQAAGWQVSKLPGPAGKREMVRAAR